MKYPPLTLYESDREFFVRTAYSNTDPKEIYMKVGKVNLLHFIITKSRYDRDFEKLKPKEILFENLPVRSQEVINQILFYLRETRTEKTLRGPSPSKKSSVSQTNTIEEKTKSNWAKKDILVINFFIHHPNGSQTEHAERLEFSSNEWGVVKKLHINVQMPKPIEIIKEVQPTKTFSFLKPWTWFK